MHDQHDDPLERELSRLSEYTGEQPTTPLWQQAIDAHRREQQQRLWVWIRRPAPALAAAALAVLVASVALRPIEMPGVRKLGTEKTELAERNARALTTLASGADPKSAKFDSQFGLRQPTPDNPSPSLEDLPEKVLVDKGDRTVGGWNHQESTGGARQLGAGRGAEVAMKDQLAGTMGRGGAGGGGGGETGGVPAAGNALDALKGTKSEEAARLARNAAPDFDAVRNAPAMTAPPARADLEYTDLAARYASIPEPTANLSLAVPDVGTFYKYVPSLLDAKLGEQVLQQNAVDEAGKNRDQTLNVTLRVNEERLAAVIEELKKSGRVQAESGQQLAKETRISQIDALLDAEKQVALKQEQDVKEAGNKGVPEDHARRQQAEGAIDALNRRRTQIEKGGELATINIVAVPEALAKSLAPEAPAMPSIAIAPPPAAPASAAAPAASPNPSPSPSAGPGGTLAGGERTFTRGASDSGSKAGADPAPAKAATPAAETANGSRPAGQDSRTPAPTNGVPAVAGDDRKRSEETLARDKTKIAPGMPSIQAPPGAAPDRASTGSSTQPPPPAPPALIASTEAPSAQPALKPVAEPAPAGVAQPASPGDTTGRGEPSKLGQATKEGLSDLGDSTAGFVRHAIGSMLYWLPALVVVLAGIWWWRRRAAAAAKEPPPQ